jgi:hypothetical protein
MKAIVGMLAAATLVFSSGCVQKDWIDRTLVTVDVTGVWQGTYRQTSGVSGGTDGGVTFVLQQQGAKVTGEIRSARSSVGASEGGIRIEGTVSGDTFTFHDMTGPQMRGEFQVNGDEMIGSWTQLATRRATLRRRE